MNTSIYKLLSQSLGFAEKQIEKTIELLDSGATIPFISRYRKEATGSLDEVQIGNIKEAYNKLCETEKRKKFIISTIEEQGKLSEELKQRIDSCWDITELEDIYLPYKPRRRTRAEIAREHGLEPLAKIIMAQKSERVPPDSLLPKSPMSKQRSKELATLSPNGSPRTNEPEIPFGVVSSTALSSMQKSLKGKKSKAINTAITSNGANRYDVVLPIKS